MDTGDTCWCQMWMCVAILLQSAHKKHISVLGVMAALALHFLSTQDTDGLWTKCFVKSLESSCWITEENIGFCRYKWCSTKCVKVFLGFYQKKVEINQFKGPEFNLFKFFSIHYNWNRNIFCTLCASVKEYTPQPRYHSVLLPAY